MKLTNKQRELIKQGAHLAQTIKVAQAELDEVEEQLGPLAVANRAENEALLVVGDTQLRVEWPTSYKVNEKAALALKRELGDEWSKFFSEHLTINRARTYGKMVEATFDAIRHQIVDAVDLIVSKTPKFRW